MPMLTEEEKKKLEEIATPGASTLQNIPNDGRVIVPNDGRTNVRDEGAVIPEGRFNPNTVPMASSVVQQAMRDNTLGGNRLPVKTVDTTNYNINTEPNRAYILAGSDGYRQGGSGSGSANASAIASMQANSAIDNAFGRGGKNQLVADAIKAMALNAEEQNKSSAGVAKPSGLSALQQGLMAQQAEVNKYLMNLADRAEMGGSVFIKGFNNPAMETLKNLKGLMDVKAGGSEAENLAKAGLANTSADLAPGLAESERKHRDAQGILAMAQADSEPSKAKYYLNEGLAALTKAKADEAIANRPGLIKQLEDKGVVLTPNDFRSIAGLPVDSELAKPITTTIGQEPIDYSNLEPPSDTVANWQNSLYEDELRKKGKLKTNDIPQFPFFQ